MAAVVTPAAKSVTTADALSPASGQRTAVELGSAVATRSAVARSESRRCVESIDTRLCFVKTDCGFYRNGPPEDEDLSNHDIARYLAFEAPWPSKMNACS